MSGFFFIYKLFIYQLDSIQYSGISGVIYIFDPKNLNLINRSIYTFYIYKQDLNILEKQEKYFNILLNIF